MAKISEISVIRLVITPQIKAMGIVIKEGNLKSIDISIKNAEFKSKVQRGISKTFDKTAIKDHFLKNHVLIGKVKTDTDKLTDIMAIKYFKILFFLS